MAALSTLTPEHRAVVVLRYVLEYTPGEIARALDLPARDGQLPPAPGAGCAQGASGRGGLRGERPARDDRAPGADRGARTRRGRRGGARVDDGARRLPGSPRSRSCALTAPGGARAGRGGPDRRHRALARGGHGQADHQPGALDTAHLARSGTVAARAGQAPGLQCPGDLGRLRQRLGEAPGRVDAGELVPAREVPGRGLCAARWPRSIPPERSPGGCPSAAVGDPRWYSPSGYRVAYRSGADLREVAGDGRGDHLLATQVAPVAPAWRPGHDFQVAYVTRRGAVVVRGGDTGVTVWRSGPHPGRPLALSWSPYGTRLVLVTSAGAWLSLPGQAPPLHIRLPVRGPVLDARASPDGRWLALVRGTPTSGHPGAATTSAAPDRRPDRAGAPGPHGPVGDRRQPADLGAGLAVAARDLVGRRPVVVRPRRPVGPGSSPSPGWRPSSASAPGHCGLEGWCCAR